MGLDSYLRTHEGNTGLTKDQVQRAINLKPNQLKAWRAFERAVKGLKKNNVELYQVLHHVSGLNGDHIKSIENSEYTSLDYKDPGNLQNLSYPTIDFVDGWADDTHIVILKK